MAQGRKTGGRRKGTKNKLTVAREIALRRSGERIAHALGERAFTGDAHDLLSSVYKDEWLPLATRIDAAKAALPFERPRLASISYEALPRPTRTTAEEAAEITEYVEALLKDPSSERPPELHSSGQLPTLAPSARAKASA